MKNKNKLEKEIATFAVGCFWGGQKDFGKKEGVLTSIAGYMDEFDRIGYKEDSENDHLKFLREAKNDKESIRIPYDKNKTSYKEILETFWNSMSKNVSDHVIDRKIKTHFPAIYYHNEGQRKIAEEQRNQILKNKKNYSKEFLKKVEKTEIKKAQPRILFRAPREHQKLYIKPQEEKEKTYNKVGEWEKKYMNQK